MIPIDNIIIRKSITLAAALKVIDEGAFGIALMVDAQGRLRRTVTDGDIRRLLISGNTLDDTLDLLEDQEPKVGQLGISPKEAMRLMNEASIDHLPLVDNNNHPISIVVRREMDNCVPLSLPHMSGFEQTYVDEAFDNNWIAPVGTNIDHFEKELADEVGALHAVALSSGTAAIHLALSLLGVASGDTVFCSSLTFVASANPILYQGATPVFIDSEPGTWNMSPVALEAAFKDARKKGRSPKAVIVVNLYGQSADMDPIGEICESYGVPVIEDAAESLGATYKKKSSGTIGELGVYSFNGNKIITTSGGGMLVSRSGELIERARFLSTQARDNAPYYQHSVMGYNYRMSNILAGIGRGQLKVLKDRVKARREVFNRYAEALSDVDFIEWMPEAPFGTSTRWLSVLTIDRRKSSILPEDVITRLADRDIEARRIWKPMHLQPLFAENRYFTHGDESISDRVFETGICLPSGSGMTEEQQKRVIDALIELFSQ